RPTSCPGAGRMAWVGALETSFSRKGLAAIGTPRAGSGGRISTGRCRGASPGSGHRGAEYPPPVRGGLGTQVDRRRLERSGWLRPGAAGSRGSVLSGAAGLLLSFGRFAHVEHAYVEVEGLAGQRVVAVDPDRVRVNFDHRHQQRATLALRLELHARLDLVHALERLSRQHLDHALVTDAVGLLGAYLDLQRVAGLLAGQRLLQAGDDVAGAVEIAQRT